MSIVLCAGCAAVGAIAGRAAQRAEGVARQIAGDTRRRAKLLHEKAAFKRSVEQLEAFHAF